MTRLESDYYSYMDFDPEHTREVLRHYVPMFEDNSPVLELGCGRGEFLELLTGLGVLAAQAKRYFEELDHLGTTGLRRARRGSPTVDDPAGR